MSIWFVSAGLILELIFFVGVMIIVYLGGECPFIKDLKVVLMCVLFGGVGGCLYCLRGVYLNACVHRRWDTTWLPWYFIRPVVSLILGGISYLFVSSGLLLFGADRSPDDTQLGLWAVAFLAGLNVDKFIAKIESLGQTTWGLEPSRQSKSNNDSSINKE
ncbi:TPA: hypothetical protein L3746_005409 [Pseudomonas aeruginosa]|uniref:hypothetical protein n=1 Tax=Pseudomonas aeruginosa TaxID=287 RepID=UPI00350F5B1F|nr:hypothetical protein [Pseudomonas aeruginosa]MCO2313070.1 hypothetical protein [Pseudomonas aeruginosa]HBN8619753.1 hypothetical protein [Pseudomonas aeruginosa]